MTKEELDIQKEIENYFTESTGFGRDKIKNFMDIVNKALKQKGEQIVELEKKNAELKSIADFQTSSNMDRYFQLKRSKDQLTKAKKLLKETQGYIENEDDELYDKIEQFLKEIEK